MAGIPGQPEVYYFGTPGGGVWKTTDAGRVWKPIFDPEHVASIGAIAVAPSDPNTVYVGTGEQTPGNGVYRSTDSGRTWSNIGLRDAQYVQAIVVDPRKPNVAVVATNSLGFGILWPPYPKSASQMNRGIFKTADGGKTWKKVFANDETLGVVDMCPNPGDVRTMYAVLFRAQPGSGANAVPATSEIVKSTDEGSTWKTLQTKGLPEKGRGRLGMAVAPGAHGRRLYAIMNQGFFRSDDAGLTWLRSTTDPRIVGNEYFSRIFVDTRNPDTLYVAQTSLYRSTDGGHTFEAYVGAPSGDDFHVLWIDPQNPARMLLGVDQGAIISVDAGHTWTSWYNQPTGQFYHVSTDDAFPYRVYAAQQDSGTAAIVSRSDYGEITARDWFPIAGFEFCYIAADPRNSNIVYSGGWYGSVVRFEKTTGQVATVFERGKRYRTAMMPPLIFSPHDPSTLYLGTQFVMKTADGSASWHEISPDLTGYVEKEGPETEGREKPPPPAITALAPSPVKPGEIWAGTSNRIIQFTPDAGASWHKVSPPGLAEPAQILSIEASHHDPGTVYITAGNPRDPAAPPYAAKTHDYGHTWQQIAAGLPPLETVRVVREDPVRRGLLYAGTQTGVFVSRDDGEHWESLQLNLPTAPVTDLVIHDNDLVVATFGRALWIMDDLTPIREMNPTIAASDVHFFVPEPAIRARWDNNQDTPLPPETPAGENPPDGAILNYFLKSAPAGEITLAIYDAQNKEVRRFSSQPKAPDLPPPNVPEYWFAPPEALSKTPGVNRFVWDLRYPSPPALPFSYFGGPLDYTEYTLAEHAIPGDTPRQQPQGPFVVPGNYTLELKVGNEVVRHPITIKLDPRVHASVSDLEQQLALAQRIAQGMATSHQGYHQVAALRKALAERQKTFATDPHLKEVKDSAAALEKKIDVVDKGSRTAPGFGPANRDLARLAAGINTADTRPSDTAVSTVRDICKSLGDDFAKWRELNERDLASFNSALKTGNLQPLPVVAVEATKGCSK